MSEPVPLRVAVVGAGDWGEQHARVFATRPDTELCAVVSRSADRATARASAYRTRPYTRVPDMLAAEQPDLVSVCLPSAAHFAPTLELLRTGVALLVEKPLVLDLREADVLLAEAAAAGTFFAINFNHRYAEPVVRARAAIADPGFGEVVFACWRFGGEPGTTAHPHANLLETQCHGLDLIEHLCGPIASVTAQMRGPVAGSFSTLAVAFQLAGGGVGTLLGTYDSSYAYPGAQRLEVNGTRSRLVIEDTVRRLVVSRTGAETSEVWEAGYFHDAARDFHRTFDRHVDAIVAALRAGEPPPVPATAGRRALQIAEAIISAHATGARVAVAGAPPSPAR